MSVMREMVTNPLGNQYAYDCIDLSQYIQQQVDDALDKAGVGGSGFSLKIEVDNYIVNSPGSNIVNGAVSVTALSGNTHDSGNTWSDNDETTILTNSNNPTLAISNEQQLLGDEAVKTSGGWLAAIAGAARRFLPGE